MVHFASGRKIMLTYAQSDRISKPILLTSLFVFVMLVSVISSSIIKSTSFAQ